MLLQLKDLNKQYSSGVHALKNVSFDVKEGEFLGIIGLSGSGKSTLLRCLNRLLEPSSGSILFMGKEIAHVKGEELRLLHKQIAMVFQQFNLIDRRSVLTNVLTGGLASMSTFDSILERFAPEMIQQARKCLQIVGIEEKAELRADTLSGGQKQRVAIARSLMQKPILLLADEPVASLDPATANSVLQYFEKINKEFGTTIICSLHFLSLVRKYASRVIALRDGEMVFQGDARDINEVLFKEIYGDESSDFEIR